MCDNAGTFNPLSPFIKIRKGPKHCEFDLRKLKKCADGFVVWNDKISNLLTNSYPHHNIQKKIIRKVKKTKYWCSIPTKKHPYAGDGEICIHKVVILEHNFYREQNGENDNESGIFVNEVDFKNKCLSTDNLIVSGSPSSGTVSMSMDNVLGDNKTVSEVPSEKLSIDEKTTLGDSPASIAPDKEYKNEDNVTVLKKTSDDCFVDKPRNVHLVIFVHGLEGTPHDLAEYPHFITQVNPNVLYKFYNSQSNFEKTWTDINTLGENLLTEINLHIQLLDCKPNKISFIAHSMGGIIVRSMFNVEGIEKLKPYFHTLLTINSPHCGINYGSKRVTIGVRFLEWWFNSNSIKQLSFKDTNTLDESFLFKLSLNDAFSSFKNVLLVGNYQDNFVCGSSALIEHNTKSYYDKSRIGRLYDKMIENIEQLIVNSNNETVLIKYIVTHNSDGGLNFDRLIGRDGHVHPCDDLHFIEKIMHCSAGKYFA
uniref:DUF676 domain-containing protein n=1 Tax=Strongyloides papillosus TaxID=174720 RepID=A0A0N5BXR1_STREA